MDRNKAIVASIMALLIIIEQWTGFHIAQLTEPWITDLIAVISAVVLIFAPSAARK